MEADVFMILEEKEPIYTSNFRKVGIIEYEYLQSKYLQSILKV